MFIQIAKKIFAHFKTFKIPFSFPKKNSENFWLKANPDDRSENKLVSSVVIGDIFVQTWQTKSGQNVKHTFDDIFFALDHFILTHSRVLTFNSEISENYTLALILQIFYSNNNLIDHQKIILV